MYDLIKIAPEYRDKVAQVLQDKLKIVADVAKRMVEDGQITKDEFFEHRQAVGVVYCPALQTNAYAAKVFDDNFFRQANLDKEFYVDLYDDTFDEVVDRGGVEDTLDDEQELKKLAQLLGQKALGISVKINKALENYAENLIQSDHVQVTQKPGNVVAVEVGHGELKILGCLPSAPLKRLFFDDVERMGRVAKALFDDFKVVKIVNGVEKIVKVEIHCMTPLPNQFAHIRIKLLQETLGTKMDGSPRIKYRIEMTQLSKEEEKAAGLTPIQEHRMGWLKGEFVITELPDKQLSQIELNVEANPDFDLIPDWLIGKVMPGQITNAARALAQHLFEKHYFKI